MKHRHYHINLVILKMFLFGILMLIPRTILASDYTLRYVYLWDVSGSLLPDTVGVKDIYNGSELSTWRTGNGLWNKLKQSLVNNIESIDENDNTEIVVIPFFDNVNPNEIWRAKADQYGKQNIIEKIKAKNSKVNGYTDIGEAINKFYDICSNGLSSTHNCMFLFTDGKSTPQEKYREALNNWSQQDSTNTYGFYILVHSDAKSDDAKQTADNNHNFWYIENKAQIRIADIEEQRYSKQMFDYDAQGNRLQSSDKLDIPLKKGMHNNKFTDNYINALQFKVDQDPDYDVSIDRSQFKNGKLTCTISPKNENPREKASIKVHILNPSNNIENGNYMFFLSDGFTIDCYARPMRTITINSDKNVLSTRYYPELLWKEEFIKADSCYINLNFENLSPNSKCTLQFYAKDGRTLCSHDFIVVVNGDTLNANKGYPISSSTSSPLLIKIEPTDKSPDYSKTCFIRLENIESIDKINYSAIEGRDYFDLDFNLTNDKGRNPLVYLFLLIIAIILASIIGWWLYVLYCRNMVPRFPNTWNVIFRINPDITNVKNIAPYPNGTQDTIIPIKEYANKCIKEVIIEKAEKKAEKDVTEIKEHDLYKGDTIRIKAHFYDFGIEIKAIKLKPIKEDGVSGIAVYLLANNQNGYKYKGQIMKRNDFVKITTINSNEKDVDLELHYTKPIAKAE